MTEAIDHMKCYASRGARDGASVAKPKFWNEICVVSSNANLKAMVSETSQQGMLSRLLHGARSSQGPVQIILCPCVPCPFKIAATPRTGANLVLSALGLQCNAHPQDPATENNQALKPISVIECVTEKGQ